MTTSGTTSSTRPPRWSTATRRSPTTARGPGTSTSSPRSTRPPTTSRTATRSMTTTRSRGARTSTAAARGTRRMGHTQASFSEANFRAHLLGGLRTAAGVAGDCGEERDMPPVAADFEKVTIDNDTHAPMEVDIAKDGRAFYIELDGARCGCGRLRRQTSTVVGTIAVGYRPRERPARHPALAGLRDDRPYLSGVRGAAGRDATASTASRASR